MSVSYPTKLILAFLSGNRCAFPDCDKTLTVDSEHSNPVIIGEAAHIAGEKQGAARYDPSMTDEQRNSDDNLIYLCGNHHIQIDKQWNDFSAKRIQKMKAEHEKKVRETMATGFANVGFPELEDATRWVLQVQPSQFDKGFSLIPPEDKLRKNDLSPKSCHIITMGLSVAREVRAYVERMSQIDSDFPERLKVGFLVEYHKLKKKGHSGDALFDLMCSFAQRGFNEQAKRSAGIAVLVYLFEACEVFEK